MNIKQKLDLIHYLQRIVASRSFDVTTCGGLVDIEEMLDKRPIVLTGSRALGGIHHGSDFDFFTPAYSARQQLKHHRVDDLDIRWLSLRGWVVEDVGYAERDDEVTVVFKKGLVHLQVVRDFKLKLAAQLFILNHLSVDRRRLMSAEKDTYASAVWEMAYAAVEQRSWFGFKKWLMNQRRLLSYRFGYGYRRLFRNVWLAVNKLVRGRQGL